MAKYGMAIDLDKCVGCGACAIACKTENNTEFQRDGQKFNWADFLTFTEGSFTHGNLKFRVIPVLCNHCSDAPCVEACPVTPKAMYKTEDGITMHNDDLCIGCQMCQAKCPYSEIKVTKTDRQYSVISYNSYEHNTQEFYDDETSVIPGGTSSPAETADLAGTVPPHMNEYTHPDYHPVRPPNVTEKCIFCDHRLKNDELPYCVVSCPAGARIFGDLDDPASEVSVAIASGYHQLKNNSGQFLGSNESGTQPNVFYIGELGPLDIDEKPDVMPAKEYLKVFPNPVSTQATVEFDLQKNTDVTLLMYSISGKLVKTILTNQSMTSGKHLVEFDVNGISAGTYIVSLRAENKSMSYNIVVAK